MVSLIKTTKSKRRKILSAITSVSMLFSTFTGAGLFVANSAVAVVATDGWTTSWPTPDASNISGLAVSPDFANDKTVLAAAENGVVRSIDGGARWSQVSDTTSTVNSVVSSPTFSSDHIAFAVTTGGVSKSVDSGASWSAIPNSPTKGQTIAISPAFGIDQTLFLAGNGGVYKSTNKGASWSAANDGLTGAFATVVMSPSYASDGIVFAGGYNGLFKSTNGGKNWSGAMGGIPAPPKGSYVYGCNTLALSPRFQTDHTVFAQIYGSLYESTNSGDSWTAVADQPEASLNTLVVSYDAANNQVVFAGSANGLVKSTDGGAKWKPADQGLIDDTGVPATIYSLMLSPDYSTDQTVFVGTLGAGLFKSIDGGENWRTPFGNQSPTCLTLSRDFASDKLAFAATDAGVFKSGDAGVSWSASNIGLTDLEIGGLVVSPNIKEDKIAFLATADGVFESTDTGSSWAGVNYASQTNLIGTALAISSNFANDHMVFCGGRGLVSRSSDGGRHWTPLRNGISGQEVNGLAVSPNFDSDRTLFAGTVTGGVYKSTDAGANWRSLAGSPHYGVRGSSLTISPNYWADHTVFVSAPGWGAYKSTDGGENWDKIDAAFGSTYVYSYAFSPNYAANKTVFAGVYGKGVFKSTDGGINWTPFNTGLSTTNVNFLAVAPAVAGVGSVYAATNGSGVFCYSTDTIPPTAPKDLAITPGTTGLNLTWTASTDNEGVTSYAIERSLDGIDWTDWNPPVTVKGNPPATSYSDTGASNDTTYYYRVRAYDAVGNPSGISNIASGMKDTKSPTVKGAATTFSASAITVSWKDTTDTGSGLDHVTVERSTDKNSWTPVNVPIAATSVTDGNLKASTVYYYRVSAYDKQGNSASAVLPGQKTYLRVVREDNAPYIIWNGTWASASDSKCSGGTAKRTTTKSSAAGITFRGTNVYWMGTKGPGYGKADVYLDGTLVKTVDQYAATTSYGQAVFQAAGLTDTAHTLQIVSKDSGKTTEVDRVMIDGPCAGVDREETVSTAELTWTGKWSSKTGNPYSKQSMKYSLTANSSAEFSFTGTSVTWIGTKASDRGYAKIYIDGKQITDGNALSGAGIDLYAGSAACQQPLYTKAGLTNAKHKIKIVVAGSKRSTSSNTVVDVDAFVVR